MAWSTALAQATPSTNTPGAPRANTVQEILVTARKRAEDVQSVPVAITAIGGDQLKNESVKTVGDLQGLVPGLQLQQALSDPQSLLFLLRGREQSDVALPIDPSVGLYVDGYYVPRTLGMAGSLLDINRVEVLRGPQGTLYGKNTTGGAIAIYTNDPSNKYFASLDATAGNYGAWNLVGIANLPINPNLAARFVVQRGTHDGYGHNAAGDELLSEKSQSYRGKLRARWGASWSAQLSAGYQSYQSGGPIINLLGLDPAAGPFPEGGTVTVETELETGKTEAQSIAYLNSFVAAGRAHFYDDPATSGAPSSTDRGDIGFTIRGDLANGIQFVSITGFEQLHEKAIFPSPLPVAAVAIGASKRDSYYSQEFQILGHEGAFRWVAGVFADYEDGHDRVNTRILPALFAIIGMPALSVSENELISSSVAPYGQATWEFLPDWRLTGGVRYSRDKRQLNAADFTVDPVLGTACVVPAPGVESTAVPGAASQCPRKFENTFGQPSWLVSLDHQLTRNILVYAKVATGYRTGGENEGGAVEIESFAPFQPETNLEYEVGLKSELFDRRVRLNLAAYHDSYNNLQVTTARLAADGNFVTLVGNAATARIQGVEAEGDVIIMRGLKVHASTAYTDARYIKFIDPQLGDRSHELFSLPKWTASISGQYDRPVGFGDVLFEVDYDWKSSINLSPDSTVPTQVTQGPVGLLNLRADLHVNALNMDIAIFVKNVRGQQYYANDASFAQLGVNFGYAAPPRIFGIEIIKKFGG